MKKNASQLLSSSPVTGYIKVESLSRGYKTYPLVVKTLYGRDSSAS